MAAQESCNITIDYSKVGDGIIIPFVVELDLAASVLDPLPGQNQRFCYNVTGVGQDIPEDKDLSHLLLGICDQITQADLKNVTVVIDGEEQTVVIGDNVSIVTADNPDHVTGCIGLKIDFPLDKVEGEMTFCFELEKAYPIGPDPVCLAAAGDAKTGLSICGPVCGEQQNCPVTGYQTMDICVPVTVRPIAIAGIAKTHCCGDPVVTAGATCTGTNRTCVFTITQTVCVEVPVEFGATASVGDPTVECGEASSEDICADCDEQ